MAQLRMNRAARRGRLEEVQLFVAQAPTLVKLEDHYGWTPLHHATFGGHVHVINYLLDEGAPINHKDRAEETALHWACDKGHLEVVGLLLERGADATIRGHKGRTPMVAAAVTGRPEVVKLLLERHLLAHAQQTRLSKRNTAESTVDHTHSGEAAATPPVVQTESAAHGGGDIDVDTHTLTGSGGPSGVRVSVLDTHVCGGERDTQHTQVCGGGRDTHTHVCGGDTGAHVCVEGAGESYVDGKDDKGQTALWHACAKYSADLVRLLLEAGADPCTPDKRGRTPRSMAMKGGFYRMECKRMIQDWERTHLLCKARRLCDADYNDHRSPFHYTDRPRRDTETHTPHTPVSLRDVHTRVSVIDLCSRVSRPPAYLHYRAMRGEKLPTVTVHTPHTHTPFSLMHFDWRALFVYRGSGVSAHDTHTQADTHTDTLMDLPTACVRVLPVMASSPSPSRSPWGRGTSPWSGGRLYASYEPRARVHTHTPTHPRRPNDAHTPRVWSDGQSVYDDACVCVEGQRAERERGGDGGTYVRVEVMRYVLQGLNQELFVELTDSMRRLGGD